MTRKEERKAASEGDWVLTQTRVTELGSKERSKVSSMEILLVAAIRASNKLKCTSYALIFVSMLLCNIILSAEKGDNLQTAREGDVYATTYTINLNIYTDSTTPNRLESVYTPRSFQRQLEYSLFIPCRVKKLTATGVIQRYSIKRNHFQSHPWIQLHSVKVVPLGSF